MSKRSLRVLTLSLGVLFGAVLGAPCAKAGETAPPVSLYQGATFIVNPEITLKVQLSSHRLYPLEPVELVVTLTNNGQEEYDFPGWRAVEMEVQSTNGLDGATERRVYPLTWTGYHTLVLKAHKSTSLCSPIGPASYYSQIFARPGHCQIRPLFAGASENNCLGFDFENCALPDAEVSAAAFLRNRGLERYFVGAQAWLPSIEPKKNSDGTIRIGEAESELQQFQEFGRQFPTSRYAPWAQLAQFAITARQIMQEGQTVMNMKIALRQENFNVSERTSRGSSLTEEEIARSIEAVRRKWERLYGAAVVKNFVAGLATPLHPTKDLAALQVQLVDLAPTLPAPAQSRAWILAADIAQHLDQDDDALRYLEKALSTNSPNGLENTLDTALKESLTEEINQLRWSITGFYLTHSADYPLGTPSPSRPSRWVVYPTFSPAALSARPSLTQTSPMPPHSPSLDRPRYAELPRPALHATRP